MAVRARRSSTSWPTAALKAARGLIRDFGEVEQLQVSVKGPGDFVSTADLKAERTLQDRAARAPGPATACCSRKAAPREGTDPRHRWIVDPLDGTTNFLHGIPHFAISIGLERDGEIVAGVVYEPTRDEMFWAEKGIGAYLNDRRLRVSARRQLGEAVIGTGMPFRGRGDQPSLSADAWRAVMAATSGRAPVRRRRARPRLCRGRAASTGSGNSACRRGTSPPALLLVREAGGYVSDLAGGQTMMTTGDILAANDHLHLPLAALIKEAMREPARSAAAATYRRHRPARPA